MLSALEQLSCLSEIIMREWVSRILLALAMACLITCTMLMFYIIATTVAPWMFFSISVLTAILVAILIELDGIKI
jgi:hypothetical protein